MHFSGQVSLEYLLLLLCIFSVFAFLLPVIANVFDLCVFGLDVANAANFSSSLKQEVEEILFQGDGAAAIVHAKPLGNWIVFSSDNTVFVEVQGSETTKVFSVEFPNQVGFFKERLSSQTSFVVRKVSGKILFEYY